MSLFDFLGGATDSLSNYVTGERQRARDLEDQELKNRVDMLRALAASPHFNSKHIATLMDEIGNSVKANGTRPRKSGKAGFMGQHEGLPPMHQILNGMITGDPNQDFQYSGDTHEVPMRGAGQLVPGGPIDLNVLMGGQPIPLGGSFSGDRSGAVPLGGPSKHAGAPPSFDPATAPALGSSTTGQPLSPKIQLPSVPLTPVPDAQLPKPPGTATMASASNLMAQETQQPAAKVRTSAGSGLPPMPFPQHSIDALDSGYLYSPEQENMLEANRMASTKYAGSYGDIAGEIAGLIASGVPEDQARASVLRKFTSGANGQTFGEGGVVEDPNSPTGWSQELYLRTDPTQRQRIPAQPPYRYGTDREAVAQRLFNKSYGQLSPAEQAEVQKQATQLAGDTAGARTTGSATAAAKAPLSTEQRLTATNQLREQWRKVDGPMREMQRQLSLMETGLRRFNEGDKIGGSQAVLVTFQKILDPTSVVRESEYERTPAGLGLIQRLEGQWERLKAGGAGVPPEELASMVETGRQFLSGLSDWNALERSRIQANAAEYGIDPALVLGTAGVGLQPPPGSADSTANHPARPAAGATPAAPSTPTASGFKMINGTLYKDGKPY